MQINTRTAGNSAVLPGLISLITLLMVITSLHAISTKNAQCVVEIAHPTASINAQALGSHAHFFAKQLN